MKKNSLLKAQVSVNLPVNLVWDYWTSPAHIQAWNNVDENWHTPLVEIDLKSGGEFLYRMESKDGTQGFDHQGRYLHVIPYQRIEYELTDGRKSLVEFVEEIGKTRIIETFDPESKTPLDIQQEFCTSILRNFKNHAETWAANIQS